MDIGVQVSMVPAISSFFGAAVLLASLGMVGTMDRVVQAFASQAPHGTFVVLPHSCTAQERRMRGDGRELFVQYRADHSSLLNERLLSTEADLRKAIAHEMSSRQERVVFVSAEASMNYGEVATLLSDLEEDASQIPGDPPLFLLLVTQQQIEAIPVVTWVAGGKHFEYKDFCFLM